jgi:hypothetical protein
MAFIMGGLLLSFSFIVPHMTFLAEGYKAGTIESLYEKYADNPDMIAKIPGIADDGVTEYLSQLKMTI